MAKDTYICDWCGIELEWNASDENRGSMWGCEECESSFCAKCFSERHGMAAYVKMMQESNLIYCPECFEKHKEDF